MTGNPKSGLGATLLASGPVSRSSVVPKLLPVFDRYGLGSNRVRYSVFGYFVPVVTSEGP